MVSAIKLPTRSSEQNRYLWGVVYPTILTGGGDALTGFRDEDLHELFLGEHFGVDRLKAFGRMIEKPKRRSSRLNTSEFSDFVMHIQSRVAEMGIVIPDPDEQH